MMMTMMIIMMMMMTIMIVEDGEEEDEEIMKDVSGYAIIRPSEGIRKMNHLSAFRTTGKNKGYKCGVYRTENGSFHPCSIVAMQKRWSKGYKVIQNSLNSLCLLLNAIFPTRQ